MPLTTNSFIDENKVAPWFQSTNAWKEFKSQCADRPVAVGRGGGGK